MKKNVNDLKEGDRFNHKGIAWVVGLLLKPFDPLTVRVSVTPENDMPELANGEYTTLTFDKEVILNVA